MKLRKIKKAFTLVELVVVIAIIAILSGVSIAVYSNITEKAKESNDLQLISQVNQAIALYDVNHDLVTCHDAVLAAEEYGLSVAKFAPNANGYEYVWNQDTKLFALLDKDGNTVFGTLNANNAKNWKISSTLDEDSVNPIYLNSRYSGVGVTTSKSIDVGYNQNLNVKYIGSGDAMIVTNKSLLTIESSNGSIKHYGSSTTLNLAECAFESYHEYGRVEEELKFTKGRLVLEKGSIVPTIQILASDIEQVQLKNSSNNEVLVYGKSVDVSSLVNPTEKISSVDRLAKVVINGEEKDELTSEVLNQITAPEVSIKLLADVNSQDNEQFNFKSAQSYTLDLNGHNMTVSNNIAGTSQYFNVEGSLTIKDSSFAKSGTIEYASEKPDPGWGYGTYTIIVNNGGTLDLESGTILNSTVNGASYAVEVHHNWSNKEAKFIMNGGVVSCPRGDQAIRVYSNHNTVSGKAICIINGGEVLDTGIWVNTQTDQSSIDLTVNGGKITGMLDFQERGQAGLVNITVNGGQFFTNKLRIRKPSINEQFIHILGGRWIVEIVDNQNSGKELSTFVEMSSSADVTGSCQDFAALKK